MAKDAAVKQSWAELVDASLLRTHLEAVNQFGAGSGAGVSRLGYSDEENAAHQYMADVLADAGCDIHVDAFGNLYGFSDRGPARSKGGVAPRKTILIGSHLDSVHNGGRYDGALGVVIAAEIARIAHLTNPRGGPQVAAVAWRCEESARFNVGTVGSRTALGRISLEDAHQIRDDDEVSLADAIDGSGFDSSSLGTPTLGRTNPHSYWEVHIEQGPVLEQLDVPVGVVTGISNQTRLRVSLAGKTMHSGATPMPNRRDALAGSAEMVLEIERLVTRYGGPSTVGHVGKLSTNPNRANTIAGETQFVVDLRDMDVDRKAEIADRFERNAREIAQRRRLEIEIETLWNGVPQRLPSETVNRLSDSARELGIPFHELPSGGGHDGKNFADLFPVGMLFVRSPGAVSHHPDEAIVFDDVVKCTQVLANAVERIVT